jgi:hypothetical protein
MTSNKQDTATVTRTIITIPRPTTVMVFDLIFRRTHHIHMVFDLILRQTHHIHGRTHHIHTNGRRLVYHLGKAVLTCRGVGIKGILYRFLVGFFCEKLASRVVVSQCL